MTDVPLVSVCLPTRNGVGRMEKAVASALAQDHPNLELVITDNASTDGTEDYCRALAAADPRVVYVRQPENVGILGNFMAAARAASGEYLRWLSDDDRLEPSAVSRCVAEFTADPRLVLVTCAISYTGDDGVTGSLPYPGTGLGSDDPLVRFAEILRLLNASHLLIDPLYGLFRREVVTRAERRNMLREDEVFAARLALAGPWAHVPEVLGHRNWKSESPRVIARRLGVPAWTARFALTLQCREMLRRLSEADLSPAGLRRARLLVLRFFLVRQRRTYAHRARRLGRIVLRRE